MGNSIPILIGMENITKLFEITLIQIGMWQTISNVIGMEYTATLFAITSSSIFKKSLIILGKMFFCLENKTKRKLVLNLEALCKECDFQTWQKFLSPTQILSWAFFFPLTLLLVITSDYFEKQLPDITTFHHYFPLHTFGVEIDNFMIIFVEHMIIKIFPDWLIFYFLPLIIPKLWKCILKIFNQFFLKQIKQITVVFTTIPKQTFHSHKKTFLGLQICFQRKKLIFISVILHLFGNFCIPLKMYFTMFILYFSKTYSRAWRYIYSKPKI